MEFTECVVYSVWILNISFCMGVFLDQASAETHRDQLNNRSAFVKKEKVVIDRDGNIYRLGSRLYLG